VAAVVIARRRKHKAVETGYYSITDTEKKNRRI
jgi:hypothetical protein